MHNIAVPINNVLNTLAGCCSLKQRVRHIVITDWETETDSVLVTFKCINLSYRDSLSAGSTDEASGQTDIMVI